MSKPVFISYSTDDTTIATQIRDGLEAAGIPCWMAPRDIVPGREYPEQILDAIEACQTLVVVVSETSNVSRFVRNEVERAVAKDKTIVPVRIHDVRLSRSLEFLISTTQWVDAVESIEGAVAALIGAIVPGAEPPGQAVEAWQGDRTPEPAFRHNLPAPGTPFVGRAQELAEVMSLFAQADVRLVTILGPGGMGKTRLGIEVGRRALADRARFPDGVFFVPLAPLDAPDYIVPAIAENLGLQLETGQQTLSLEQQVCGYLSSRKLLLILDNYEHILDGAGVVTRLLPAAPELRILVTSRERLHLHDEQLYAIQGLEFPAWQTPDDAGTYSAAQLFVQSARRIQSDYALRPEDLPPLTHICQLVSGVPLAIELAAGWIEMLPLTEIAEEIEQNLDILETENQDVPDRQRSMRAVFDYSWRRLTIREQEALAQLSVFRGGFDRSAARQVASASIRTLASLVAKSLVQVHPNRDRYDIHELVRQYAAEELERMGQLSSEAEERHMAFYGAFLRTRTPELKTGRQLAAIREIEADLENVRAAWTRALRRQRLQVLEEAQEGLCLFYEFRGRYEEGAQNCHNGAGTAANQALPRLWTRLLTWQAIFEHGCGHHEAASALLHRSLHLLESAELAEEQAWPEWALVHMALGGLAFDRGEFDDAKNHYDLSLRLFEGENDTWYMAKVLLELGNVTRNHYAAGSSGEFRQQLKQAEAYIQRSLSLCREIGDKVGTASGLYHLGVVERFDGDDDRARIALEESRVLSEELNLIDNLVRVEARLGTLYAANNDLPAGRVYTQRAVERARAAGLQHGLGAALPKAGAVAGMDGDYVAADRYIAEGTAINRRLGSRHELAVGLLTWAHVDLSLGRRAELHRHLVESLKLGVEMKDIICAYCLRLICLLLVERDEVERSTEIYSLIADFRYRPDGDGIAQVIAAQMAALPPDVAAAAVARGRQLDFWQTAQDLLDEITGWETE